MKRLKRKCLLALLALPQILLFSCSNVLEENPNTKLSPRELAEKYFRYERFWDNLFAGRELNSEDSYPDYFKNIEIVDENEQKIDFDSLSKENKKAAFELWKETEVSIAAERITEDENLYNILVLELSAMNETEKIAERKAISNSESDIKWLLNKYLKIRSGEYKKFEKENAKSERSSSSGSSSGSSSSSQGYIPSNEKLVENSVNLLKSAYAPGRIFVCTDSFMSSSSSNVSGTVPYAGHAAIMSENEWSPKWANQSDAKATVSAWPNDGKTTTWKGKIEGAQYEPIGYWAGNFNGAARSVNVLQMQRLQIRWNWIFFYFSMEDAPYNESQVAVNYAKNIANENESNGNHPYNIGWSIASQVAAIPTFSKWWPSTCYCSQLVWRSWVNANIMYDYLAPLDLILPMNLALSPGVRHVIGYSNW